MRLLVCRPTSRPCWRYVPSRSSAIESGVGDTVDPLAGSYYVESLTDSIEAEAMRLIQEIDDLGGAVAAIEAGFQAGEIEDAAYRYAGPLMRER